MNYLNFLRRRLPYTVVFEHTNVCTSEFTFVTQRREVDQNIRLDSVQDFFHYVESQNCLVDNFFDLLIGKFHHDADLVCIT